MLKADDDLAVGAMGVQSLLAATRPIAILYPLIWSNLVEVTPDSISHMHTTLTIQNHINCNDS